MGSLVLKGMHSNCISRSRASMIVLPGRVDRNCMRPCRIFVMVFQNRDRMVIVFDCVGSVLWSLKAEFVLIM